MSEDLVVKGTGVDGQSSVHGTEEVVTKISSKDILLAFGIGLIVILILILGIYFQNSVTSSNSSSVDLNQLSSDLNSCLNRLSADEYVLQQVSDLNFPYLILEFPLESKTFEGVVLVDSNKRFVLDVVTLRNLVQEYGVEQ